MNKFFKTLGGWIRSCVQKFRVLSLTGKIIAAVVIIIIAFLLGHLGGKKTEQAEVTKADREVTVASVLTLSDNAAPLPLLGTVT